MRQRPITEPELSHVDRERERRPQHNAANGAGDWIRTASALVPLLIGELVTDPTQRWRYIEAA